MDNRNKGGAKPRANKASKLDVRVRVTPEEKQEWNHKALEMGFDNLSAFIRHLVNA